MTVSTPTQTTPAATTQDRPSADPLAGLDPQLIVALARVDEMLAAGQDGPARRELRRIEAQATPAQRAALADTVTAHEVGLAEAAAEQLHRRQVVRWVAPSRVQVRRGPRKPSTGAAAGGAPAAAGSLLPQSVVDDRERDGGPVTCDIDYDKSAVAPMTGSPCLFCTLERTRADLGRADGLCGECREAGITRESVIHSKCEEIARAAGDRDRARVELAAIWKRTVRPEDRAAVTAWVAAHPDLVASH